jgi:two-component system, chemotaxis family, protein-glutamate methylesterase/glutaminase
VVPNASNPSCDLIVIGASAGGLKALQDLFGALPEHLPAAILVVVHMGAGTISERASILGRSTAMPVADAVDGEALEVGRVYIAIADHQLTIERGGVVRVKAGPKENTYRPCVDALFRSAAQVYGKRVVGVVLSGMLADGTAGLVAITAAGGVTIVQDPDEAGYRSMPESAIDGDHVQYCLPVSEIATLLQQLAEHGQDLDRMPHKLCHGKSPKDATT